MSGAVRHVDTAVADLGGEAASQIAVRREAAPVARSGPAENTYHGQPVLKAPVWKWPVPVYFQVGGIAGGAAVLGGVAQVLDGRRLAALVRRARWTAAIGTAASAASRRPSRDRKSVV